MTDPARQLREAVRYLIVAHGALETARRPCGAALSLPHAYALLELLHDGPLTVTQLAERLSIDRTNVSRLCARLVDDGEVEAQPHPSDRRARWLRLTPAGERLASHVDRASVAHFDRLARRLDSPTDVVAALEALRDVMTSQPVNPSEPS